MSQKHTLGLFLTAAVLMPITAQSQTLAECAALTGIEAGDGLKAVKCVATMAAQFEGFKTNTLPNNAIVLSTTRCEDFGWVKLDGSLGRTVIGAGAVGTVEPADKYVYDEDGRKGGHKLRPYLGKPYKALDAGGVEEVTLTKPQMPKHNHGGAWVISSLDKFGMQNEPKYHNSDAAKTLPSSGGDKPHNNIPPYIALYFCRKTN